MSGANLVVMAGAASGVIANRAMSTESSDTASSDEKGIDVDHRPTTLSAPARRGHTDEFLPAFFSDPWDPFSPRRTLGQVLTFMDQLMDAPFSGRGGLRTGWDAREDDKSLCLKVEMPGLSKDDVKVWVKGGLISMHILSTSDSPAHRSVLTFTHRSDPPLTPLHEVLTNASRGNQVQLTIVDGWKEY